MDWAQLLRAAAPLGGGVAIVIAALAAVVQINRSRYRAQIEAIRRASPDAIPTLLGDEVDKLGLSTIRLTKQQQYDLVLRALEQRENRNKRLFHLALVVTSCLSLLALIGFAVQVVAPRAGRPDSNASTSELTPSREVARDLTIDVLQQRLEAMTLDFDQSEGLTTRRSELPNFVDSKSASLIGAKLSAGPFSVESAGVVSGLGRFAVVARSGHYVVERLYVRVHGFADCTRRDETTEVQAPAVRRSYAFWLTKQFAKYDLVPLNEPGTTSLWRYDGPGSDEFGISFYGQPYTLFLISLVAEARDEDGGSRRFATESPIFPILLVKGNSGGCLDLASWYSPELLRAAENKSFKEQFDNELSYQLAILDPSENQSFLNETLKLAPAILTGAVAEVANVAKRFPENRLLAWNARTISNLVNKQSGSRSVAPMPN